MLTQHISLRSIGRYRRVMRTPTEPAVTLGEISLRNQKRQHEAVEAAISEYRRLPPSAPDDSRAVSGDVNRMVAAAINVDARWFWHGPEA
jgi:hypothetical protein